MEVTAAYAKANLPELLKAVQNGETVTISRYNKPVADLVPSAKMMPRPVPKFGTGKGVRIVDPNWARAMTRKELERWLGTETLTK
ncbi:MAG TPA: type II toxin-antitoxin system prevent-host-death family antitoxin [Bryobacteraceae bacterium]|nr:type II toxin-antitoxin system prevent-host-death family antitoxin [Bryobacteraceae bacterium]